VPEKIDSLHPPYKHTRIHLAKLPQIAKEHFMKNQFAKLGFVTIEISNKCHNTEAKHPITKHHMKSTSMTEIIRISSWTNHLQN